jgi:hypothetical protein
MISAPMSSFKSLWYTPFTEPTVPTGIKTGVLTSPCAVVKNPVLADEPGSFAVRVNLILSLFVAQI